DLALLDCNGLESLEEVAAQECNLSKVLFARCYDLLRLDLAENNLSEIDLSDSKLLKALSLRDNCLTNLKIRHLKELVWLAVSNNFFPPVDLNFFSLFKELKSLKFGLFIPADVGYEEAFRRAEKYKKFNKFFGSVEK